MMSRHELFIVLNNLLPLFILVFGITSSWDTPTLTEATKHDVGSRKLATQNNPGFISIDCGVEEDYLNGETGIYYKSDKDFIETGENHDIPASASRNNYYVVQWREYGNLRSFPDGKKNCYTLKPEQGRNNSYRIRASFLYGNYDGKNEIPEFELYVGVNYWDTVRLPSLWYMLFLDIIYFFTADTGYVCLVNTGLGIPFISALELRLSNDSAFNTTYSVALGNVRASDLGISSNDSFRYKDDGYDRIWQPLQFPSSVPISPSLNIANQVDDLYKVPAEVLRTAIQPVNGSRSLNYTYYSSRFPFSQYLVCFYFAEIEETARQDRLREFTITLNGFKIGPITLEYLKPLTVSSQNLPVQGVINFTIDATEESDLPPILNAMEFYQVLPLPYSPTDPTDGDAIMAIKQTYNINKDDWQGDPCLPKEYTWSGLTCRFNGTPRIISLNLSASKLTGAISLSFSDLQAIESLDLSYNELTGPVPEVLAQLPNLKVLNLSGNKLAGSVPQSLKDKSDDGSLVLRLAENPDLCQMDPCHDKEKKKFVVPVVASIVSVLVLIFFSILIVFCMIRRRRQQEPLIKSSKEGSFKSKNRPFSYSQIVKITGNFTTVVGEGGFGKVYLGTLNDEAPVAVKLLSPSSKQGFKEFRAEVQLLMIVHHRNLVSLIGYCDENGKMALIYEYMANGNLRQHLSDTNGNVLKWKERLQIAIDAAYGLEYLHNGCKPSIVHRDLKSANILLTESMQAKIADFGLSKIFLTENESHISTCPAGTPGYLDPEFQCSGNLNKKSDVYSFGIILFELITGQPAIIRIPDCGVHILQWLSPIVEKGDIRNIIDPRLQGEFDVNAAWKVVDIAMSCAQPASIQRPDMSLVLTELKECMAIEMAHGRTQRVLSNMTTSSNSPEISLLNVDSELNLLNPIPR
ncbi:PREDICTED: probable LRR receptor-like serine/threonine-protein kinase At1g05700 [Theobroma cacao]|uniref:non-specific serine/threonine protein kinase n=1 Tax=Theobroma cacao TaxID=3641 RepID=A0AB32UZ65_THECC|nr:PREDICTED: probable LRR receptor-like serine/threonine-protein kinase At1g05700 [Theobroma cacao]